MRTLTPAFFRKLLLASALSALPGLWSCATSKPRDETPPPRVCMRWDEVQGTRVQVDCSGQDQDDDGFDDAEDLCPKLPETQNGQDDQDGCPDPDADGDRIIDANDDCPHQAGPAPVGCPIRDSDGDGIVDHLDSCPMQPEVLNGIDDQDGCPDGANQTVVLRDDQLFVQQPIHFLRHSAMLLPDSKDLLERIAKQLAPHKNRIARIRIVGHCDRREVPRRKALALSKTRARIVAKYMILLGFNKKLFEIEALGNKQALNRGRSKRQREKNRRVELLISLKQIEKPAQPPVANNEAATADAGSTTTATAGDGGAPAEQSAGQAAQNKDAQAAPYDDSEDWDSEFLDDDWDKDLLKK